MIAEGAALWQRGARAVLYKAATGAGKSLTMGSIVAGLQHSRGVVQAHRAELVGQLSKALATVGVRHNLTVSSAVRREIVDQHFEQFGRSYYDPGAPWSVESVDTAIKRSARYDVRYLLTDECHHVLPGNKWGKAALMYADARIGGFTATPCRTDGKALGIEQGGLFQAMVDGPGPAELMADGYLCEYDIKISVPTDLDMSQVQLTASGEFNMTQTAAAVHASGRIVGDAVRIYQEVSPGKRAIVFAVDTASAIELRERFAAAGVAVAFVSGDASRGDPRTASVQAFRARALQVLINVDLFGEGFDVPGVEVVIMCRPTASFQWFAQAVGRCMRPDMDSIHADHRANWDALGAAGRRMCIAASRKPRGLVIDLVGNFTRTYRIGDAEHVGPPELFTAFSLDGRTRQREGIPQRTCMDCFLQYERFYKACPHCGMEPERPALAAGGATAAEHVDGNIYDYDPAMLARLRSEVARIDGPPLLPQNLTGAAAAGARSQWYERQQAQAQLREAIAVWAGANAGLAEAELHSKFFLSFNADVPSACALGSSAALSLRDRILGSL
jgi:superfamily II DNA or RNA helicase